MKIVDFLTKYKYKDILVFDKRTRRTNTLSFYHKIIKNYLYYIKSKHFINNVDCIQQRIKKNVEYDLQNFNLNFYIKNRIKDLEEAL